MIRDGRRARAPRERDEERERCARGQRQTEKPGSAWLAWHVLPSVAHSSTGFSGSQNLTAVKFWICTHVGEHVEKR